MAMILENQVLVMPNGALNSQAPLVAVFMVTYNHSSFIARAIESVLSQNTTFSFQLFIGEDASTDDTSELCRHYADQFPDKVKLFCREKNIGVFENANLLFQACLSSGAKYIAMLEEMIVGFQMKNWKSKCPTWNCTMIAPVLTTIQIFCMPMAIGKQCLKNCRIACAWMM